MPNGNDEIPLWGVLMMFVASAVGAYLLGKELIRRMGWK